MCLSSSGLSEGFVPMYFIIEELGVKGFAGEETLLAVVNKELGLLR
jgi:hypothetical protein